MTLSTATMTVDGFEHLGPILVRSRTFRDSMQTIPMLVDLELNRSIRELKEGGAEIPADYEPSQQSRYNALMIAIARCVIVDPKNLVDDLLSSTTASDYGFFGAFAEEYTDWMNGQSEEVQEKKSGREKKVSGKESASTSATDTDSPQLILDGSI